MEKGQMYAYAQKTQELIRQMDNWRNCGWIVDLRSETGGNMWGVLAGVGPLLGEGELGYFLYPDGNKLRWYYENGEAKYGNSVAIDMGKDQYSLKRPNPPVAVLIGSMTTSAGEAVAVAFRGREKTRFFGASTKGFSTANQLFYLSDQATIMLTVAVDADRTGKTYSGAIIPDEIVEPAKGETEVIDAASAWLLSLPDCQ